MAFAGDRWWDAFAYGYCLFLSYFIVILCGFNKYIPLLLISLRVGISTWEDSAASVFAVCLESEKTIG